jgi:hypothetical protein
LPPQVYAVAVAIAVLRSVDLVDEFLVLPPALEGFVKASEQVLQ